MHRHADAGGGAEGHVTGHERSGDGDAHPVGEVGDLVDGAVGDVEHGELVGPHAGDHVVVAHGLAQTPGDGDDEGVGDAAAVAVDQFLEPVEVDDQHGDQRVGVGDAAERLLEPVAQERPVGEPGERVLQPEVVGLEVGPGPLERRRHDVGEPLDEGDLVGVEGAQGGRQHRQRAVEAGCPADHDRQPAGRRAVLGDDAAEAVVGAEVVDDERRALGDDHGVEVGVGIGVGLVERGLGAEPRRPDRGALGAVVSTSTAESTPRLCPAASTTASATSAGLSVATANRARPMTTSSRRSWAWSRSGTMTGAGSLGASGNGARLPRRPRGRAPRPARPRRPRPNPPSSRIYSGPR